MTTGDDGYALPAVPGSWSDLDWRQLGDCWAAKMRFGGSPDAARAHALLLLLGLEATGRMPDPDPLTGEPVYLLEGGGRSFTVTPRQLSWLARRAMPWFDYPYGDPGEPAVRDGGGKVVRESRDPVRGYVNPGWRDAMRLPQDTVEAGGVVFALPQLACNNLTWEQYRSLQPLVPLLFQEGVGEERSLLLQAQFTAYCLVPEQVQEGSPEDRFRPAHTFRFDSERAEQSVPFWMERLRGGSAIFCICFQVYQTAVQYYEQVYPVLFGGGGREDPLRDALTGEVGTLNAVMKYAGYRSQQEVYCSFLPHVLDILNTMAREAREIEKMNSRIRKK